MYTTGPVHTEDIEWGTISTQEIKIRGGRSTELTPGGRRQDGGGNEWNGTGRGQTELRGRGGNDRKNGRYRREQWRYDRRHKQLTTVERTCSGHGAGSRYYGAKLRKTIQWDTGKGGGTAREDRQRGKGRRGQKARMDGLGCIFLPESSGFLYFPFRSPFSHRNLNFRSAVTLFFGTKGAKTFAVKRRPRDKTMVCLGYQVVQFCSFCGLKLSNWMWLLH